MGENSTLKSRLVLRNGTSAQWAEANPVLLKGEIGVENDTQRLKIGDGLAAWNDLPYSDKEMKDLITTEEQRATKAEASLQSNIDTLQLYTWTVEGTLTAKIESLCTLFKRDVSNNPSYIGELLQELGENYKDVYSLASTLKSFLEATDTANTTINKWKEIEQFLSGIFDTESLTALLSELEEKITTAYTIEIENRITERFENDVFILNGGTSEGW